MLQNNSSLLVQNFAVELSLIAWLHVWL